MPRPIIIALIASLCLTFTARAEDKLPPAVKPILEKAAREVKRNREEFTKANAKPLGEAKKALEELSTKLIKDGKAEDATLVLKQVGSLEADVMKMANAPAPVAGGGRPAPQKPLLERLEGKWTHPNASNSFDFSPDGKAKLFKKSGELDNDGALRRLSEDEVEVRWGAGWVSRFRMIDSDTIVERSYRTDGSEHGCGAVLLRLK